VRADLIGSSTCSALGITVTSSSPVLAMCRRLLAAGVDPATRLDVYRGATLAVTVRSIAEGANLEIGTKGTSFVRRAEVRAASLTRKSDRAGSEAWIDWPAATDGAVR
jgi:hypothetical protein